MTSPEFEILREWWREKFETVMAPAPLEMPPLREVNHRIPLKDPNKKSRENTPRCPAALQEALATKIDRYVKAGWWYPANSERACPLLCIRKADGSLRTVIDARNRNSNTILDVTPMPDMRLIQESVARATYRSKIDMSDAYEQIRVDPDDVLHAPWDVQLKHDAARRLQRSLYFPARVDLGTTRRSRQTFTRLV
jgi:hypothetical protein